MGTSAGVGNSTNAMGSSGVDPGQSLVDIETCPSPIGEVLDIDVNNCDCSELSSSSIFDIHRIMDAEL